MRKWEKLATTLTHNESLEHELLAAAKEGLNYVTISHFSYSEEFEPNVASTYPSDSSYSHHENCLSFETPTLLYFLKLMKGQMSPWLRIALVRNKLAMRQATKMSHNSKSTQFLCFKIFRQDRISDLVQLSNIPVAFYDPDRRNIHCSVTEFRAFRKNFFDLTNLAHLKRK